MDNLNFDIEKEGPRIWSEIHSRSLKAQTKEQKREYDFYIQDLQDKFFCLDCRNHFGKYLKRYPPWKAPFKSDKNGRDITYFYWSWKFHDSVNERLGKKRWSFKDSYKYYQHLEEIEQQEKSVESVEERPQCHLNEQEKLANALALLKEYQSRKFLPIILRPGH